MVRLLIDLGGDVTLRDHEHHGTPLGWAKYAGREAVVEFLEGLGAPA
jgi:hypothetical protein